MAGTEEMKSSLPFVSICLLTYKRADLLPRSLDSLLEQTYSNFELIINDDCSPDLTEAIGRAYEQKDTRVRYFRNERNLRYAMNQNAALSRARSDYVAIVHDGDVYRSDLIEKWTEALFAHPSAALVFNAVEAMDLESKVVTTFRHPYPPLISGPLLLQEMLQRLDSPIFGIVMLRKTCVEAVGPFDASLPTLADIDMWMRLLAQYDAAYISEPLIRIAAREVDHHNRAGNWGVRAEHEQIYSMNLARASRTSPISAQSFRRRVFLMLWWQRVLWLAWSAKNIKVQEFVAGLAFCCSSPINRLPKATSPR